MRLTRVNRISTIPRLTGHPFYKEAKNGNLREARKLVAGLIPDNSKFSNLKGFICPVIKIAGNQIPLALAERMALNSDMVLCDSVFLQHLPHGSSMTERLYYQPVFSGHIKPGNYILADDVYTTGKTLKALKNYIESNGGNVIGAWCIGAGPSLEFEPTRVLLKVLTTKFPMINRYFDLNELTSPQIHYLLRLSSLNRLWMIHADKQHSLMFV